MADLELHVDSSSLSNFADDTQSIIIENSKEELIKTVKEESGKVLQFFRENNLVNNPDKAALLFNTKGKAGVITIDNIGGEKVISKNSDKLLGLHVSAKLDWNTHVEQLCSTLKQRLGLLRRIKYKIPRNKLQIIADAIFNSKIRYGVAVYLNPRLNEGDPISSNIQRLQVLQNEMLRLVEGKKKSDCTNMARLREEKHMMSVNQMTCYHVLIETFNIVNYKSVETLYNKMMPQETVLRLTRSTDRGDLVVPKKPKDSCMGFSWTAPKLWNKLPHNIRNTKSPYSFKRFVKKWIWDRNIPV